MVMCAHVICVLLSVGNHAHACREDRDRYQVSLGLLVIIFLRQGLSWTPKLVD